METLNRRTQDLLVETYHAYRQVGIQYVYHKTFDRELAEDLVQDAFLRLTECRQMLRPDTIKAMFFTVLRNLLYDYLRRYYKQQEVNAYLYDYTETRTNNTEDTVVAADLARHEWQGMKRLTPQQQHIYVMSRYEDKSSGDIAEELGLSRRTVENHLFAGRKQIREYMRQCI
ncbi:MAG: sigma-70 family RNA polymerase sigma factor [Bacteroides sp.]|nr:sigma-70 family RNA polymerase sigma factor [Bacteroides sp.]